MPSVLVVEDDESIREMLRLILRREHFDVLTVTNGRAALEVMRDQSVHLVITDILMPEKEGIETIFELRRDYPGVKIIAISGGGRFEPRTYLDLATKIGADRTLSKPFDPGQLLEVVDELLNESH